jgi:drug/metabolite transporter (DMT)-like permease
MGALFGSLTALSIGLGDLFARRVVLRRGAVIAAMLVQGVGVVVSAIMLGVIASRFDTGDALIGLASGVGLGIGLWGYLGGLSVSSAAIVSPIVATMSAVIPFCYALVRGASASGWAVVAAVVAVAGLLLITAGGAPVANVAAGVRWSVASGLGYGFGLSIVIEATEQSGAWPAVTQRLAAFALMIGIAARSEGRVPLTGVRSAGIAAGVFGALSTIFYLLGVQADATPAVVTASMFPAVTVVVGRFVYADHVNRQQLIGLVVVLIGVAGVVAA